MDTLRIGELVRSLGAGRLTADDEIDPNVGIQCLRKLGDEFQDGDCAAIIVAKADDARTDSELEREYLSCLDVVSGKFEAPAIVLEIVER
jgi:thymidine phosphorylase